MTFLVDTGANIMIMKPSVLNMIPASERPTMEPVETFNSEDVGRGCFRIQIWNEQVVHEVWVAEIELDGIIGMDFINKHNCRLTLGQRRFELGLNGR